ncbi:conserved hypothetical protein [Candidatus Terasakiella magnetica]|nr:conserved hypothetical protein [Candidatus Terasakiella magnetica]
MLKEWIQNAPTPLVKRIVADPVVRGNPIWRLATEELARRRAQLGQAA